MELKKYQRRVIDETKAYLVELAKEQAAGNRHPALDAWEKLRAPGRQYIERRNKLAKEMPNFCLKVPTGGGKTLLATQVLGSIYSTILEKRNGAGLVLWVVPSDQIYKDTLKALRDRNIFTASPWSTPSAAAWRFGKSTKLTGSPQASFPGASMSC